MTSEKINPDETGAVAKQTPLLMQSIKEQMTRFTPGERKIARALLADYPSAGLGSVQILADKAAVSLPSVVRFCRTLGFAGFVDFQQSLREELSRKNNGPLQRLDNWRGAETTSQMMDTAIQTATDLISRSLHEIPDYEMTEAVRLISATDRRIFLGGGRISQSLAMYFGRNLQQMRKGVEILTEVHHDRIQHAIDASKNDVFVLFDFRRYQQDVIGFAREVSSRGATVILITDVHLSPIATHARVVLTIHAESPWPFEVYSAGFVLLDAIIASVMDKLGDRAIERIQSWEKLGPLSLKTHSD